MERIDSDIIAHQLSILPDAKPIQQKRRTFSPEHNQAVAKEVDKLLAANFIHEKHYLDWLSNVVMVKRANGNWWI